MIRSQSLEPKARYSYLAQQAALINRTQRRNAAARKSHRKATLRRLHQLGVKLTGLRRCQRE